MTRLRLVLVALCAVATQASAQDRLDDLFERDVLVVVANEHACYRFDIYLALSHAQKRRGLMFVRDLPPMTGMLFVYDIADYHSIWMKNTFIPLDILFARGDGTIVTVVRGAVPQSEKSMPPSEPVNFVLELNGGESGRLAIDTGSRLVWESGLDDA